MRDMSREKKLAELLGKARELSEKNELSAAESAELAKIMAAAKSLRDKIVTERSIDEFARTLSVNEPKAASSDVKIAQEGRFGVYAEREGFQKAVAAWKSGRGGSASWGFDVRYKADVDTATSETGSGALVLEGTDPGHQYGGSVGRPIP